MPGLSSTGSGAGTRGVSGPPPFPTRGLEGLLLPLHCWHRREKSRWGRCPHHGRKAGRGSGGRASGFSSSLSSAAQGLPASLNAQRQRNPVVKERSASHGFLQGIDPGCSSCRIFCPCRSAGSPGGGGEGDTCERPTIGKGGGGSWAQHLQASQRLPDGLGSALQTESPSFGAPSWPRPKSRGVWEGGTSLLPWEGSGLGVLWPCRPLPICRFISSFQWAGPEEP